MRAFLNLLKHSIITLVCLLLVCYGQTLTGVIIFGVPVTAYQSGGDMFGPGSSVLNQLMQFANTTGKLAKAWTGTGFFYFVNGVPTSPSGTPVDGYCPTITSSGTAMVWANCSGGGGGGGSITQGPGIVYTPVGNVVSVDLDTVWGVLPPYTGSIDFTSIAANTCQYNSTLTYPGAVVGDFIEMTRPTTLEGAVQNTTVTVTAGGVLVVGACTGATSVDPVNATFKFLIKRRIQ